MSTPIVEMSIPAGEADQDLIQSNLVGDESVEVALGPRPRLSPDWSLEIGGQECRVISAISFEVDGNEISHSLWLYSR